MADTLITDRRSASANYKIVRRLGKGGMAEVFLAQQEGMAGFRRLVVIKKILPQYSSVQSVADMLLDEARIAGQLNHPNIVQIHEIGYEEGQYFIAMEYVDGCDLATLARIERHRQSRVPMRLVLRVVSEAAMGLDYAHRQVGLDGRPLNVVHRDVSPHNVLCSREGAVKMTDFGIAKAVGKVQVTEVGVVKGKVQYMAPEQYTGGEIDHRADIFSLGVILYQLTTGRLPRAGKQGSVSMRRIIEGKVPAPSEVRPDYPQELESIVMRALAHNREERYRDAASLRDDLLDFARHHDLLAFPRELADYVNEMVPPDGEHPSARTPVPRASSAPSKPRGTEALPPRSPRHHEERGTEAPAGTQQVTPFGRRPPGRGSSVVVAGSSSGADVGSDAGTELPVDAADVLSVESRDSDRELATAGSISVPGTGERTSARYAAPASEASVHAELSVDSLAGDVDDDEGPTIREEDPPEDLRSDTAISVRKTRDGRSNRRERGRSSSRRSRGRGEPERIDLSPRYEYRPPPPADSGDHPRGERAARGGRGARGVAADPVGRGGSNNAAIWLLGVLAVGGLGLGAYVVLQREARVVQSGAPSQATPATAKPTAGVIDVMSNPAKADVSIDGAQHCSSTPCHIPGLPLGQQLLVTVRAPKHSVWMRRVVLSGDQAKLVLTAKLAPMPSSDDEEGADKARRARRRRARASHGSRGSGGSSGGSASGARSGKSSSGGSSGSRKAKSGGARIVRAGKRGKGKVAVVAVSGDRCLLVADVRPSWAEVWIDGKKRGNTPLQLEIEPGRHKVELRNEKIGLHSVYRVRARKGKKIKIAESIRRPSKGGAKK